jgi:hypothetical protein
MKREYVFPPVGPYKELPDFDMPTEAELEEANSFFTAYVFYECRKGGRFLWTSCCRRAENWPEIQRTMGPDDMAISWGGHNDKVRCPFCGREATLKNVRKLGKKKNLVQFEPVVFLKEERGNLFALAYWMCKDFGRKLNDPPEFMLASAYRFMPGRAERSYIDGWNGELQTDFVEGNYDPNHRKITEPFITGSGLFMKYVYYRVIGIDAIGKSSFRYCQYENFRRQYHTGNMHDDLMKYLAACCIYPRNIEMLMKAGPRELVISLVCGRKKNADIIKWGVDDPCEAFGLDRRELKEFMRKPDIDVLRIYKLMKRWKMKPTFPDAENIEACLRDEAVPFIWMCAKYGLKPMPTIRYLDKFCGQRCYGGYFAPYNSYTMWRDYLQAEAAVGYDMKNEVVLKPKDLFIAHDAAAAEHNRRLEEIQRRERAEKDAEERKRMKALQRKHRKVMETRQKALNFSGERYFIRVAETADEVIKEGKALQHCVGGYAQRHIEGATTICLLRAIDEPNEPLCTIEMRTNKTLAQIHGYQNDRGGPDPREAYAEILDPWLKWIAAGSKRDADGNPVLPEKKNKKKKEGTAA